MPMCGARCMFSNWWQENSATTMVVLSIWGMMSKRGMPMLPAMITFRVLPKEVWSTWCMRAVVVLLPLVPVTARVWSAKSWRKMSVWEVTVSRLQRPSSFMVGMPGDLTMRS